MRHVGTAIDLLALEKVQGSAGESACEGSAGDSATLKLANTRPVCVRVRSISVFLAPNSTRWPRSSRKKPGREVLNLC